MGETGPAAETDAEPGSGEPVLDDVDVTARPRLDDDVDIRALDGHVKQQPMMVDLENVSAALPDDGGDLAERAGCVVDPDNQVDHPAVMHQPAHQDRRDEPSIDVAAGDHHPELVAARTAPVLP